MSVTLILHEATRTGAPKVGGVIAAALQQLRDVRVVCLQDGPLMGWLRDRLGSDNIELLTLAENRYSMPFAERIRLAASALERDANEIVYVNSLAASEFIPAAKEVGKRAVLHLHEKVAEMNHLLAHDLTKLEVMPLCDGVVLAAGELEQDLADVFKVVPRKLLHFGIAIDAAEIEQLAAAAPHPPPMNARGGAFSKGGRLAIGMCGHASARKGCDIFFETAARLPDHDFIWVGNWGPPDTPENIVHEAFEAARLPNLYVTGGVDNPYKYMSHFDLFFLSSREDPNPLVLAEALLLRVPILAFGGTTAVTDFLGRSALLCHGLPNPDDAARVINAITPAALRATAYRRLTDGYRGRFDIHGKAESLMEFLDSLDDAPDGTRSDASAARGRVAARAVED